MSVLMRLKLTVEGEPLKTGHAHFWRVIRELDKAGPWSVNDVFDRSRDAWQSSVEDFIRRLVKAGLAEKAGVRGGLHVHRLTARPAKTPILRRDGQPTCGGLGVAQMWAAIRALKAVDYRELMVAATTEDVSVSANSAKAYLQRLDAAGYLRVIDPGNPGVPRRYALKRTMNTGPEAPRIMRTKLVWDPNRNEIMGETVAEEDRP